MSVAQTSRIAYAKVMLDKTKLGAKQQEVFDYLCGQKSASDKQIAKALDREINTITARRSDLVKLGLIMVDHIGPCPITGSTVKHWAVHESLRDYRNIVRFGQTKPKEEKVSSEQALLWDAG